MSDINKLLSQFEKKDAEAHKYNTMLTLNTGKKDDSKISFSQQRKLEDYRKNNITVNVNPYEKGEVKSITTTDKKKELKREVLKDVKTTPSPTKVSTTTTSKSNNLPPVPKKVESKNAMSGSSGGNDKYEELEKLASLRDRGIITQKEFDIKKKQILGL
ncbi:hypothetical protein ABK040_011067 [Willaertia magna]